MRINPITHRRMPNFNAELDLNDEKTKQIYDEGIKQVREVMAGSRKVKQPVLPEYSINKLIKLAEIKGKIRFGTIKYREDTFFGKNKEYHCAYNEKGDIIYIPYEDAGYDYKHHRSVDMSKMPLCAFLTHFACWVEDRTSDATPEEIAKLTTGLYPRFQKYPLNIGKYDEMSKTERY